MKPFVVTVIVQASSQAEAIEVVRSQLPQTMTVTKAKARP
jgi:hypothetical protein